VQLPPAGDARLQLCCIAAGAVLGIVVMDSRFGLGVSVRALATDGFASAVVAFTVALAAASPVLVFHHVESRDAWLALAAAQFGWPFAGLALGGIVSGRRKRRLHRLAATALDPSTAWSAGPGIDAHYDLMLQSPGPRKVHLTRAVVTVTGMGVEEAMHLVDSAPALVLHQATADHAETLLESLGATVIVSTTSTLASVTDEADWS